MSKGMKIWLWVALVLSAATTVMNFFYGRSLSVVIALCALAGLCVLLFARKKWGFYLMCACYVLAFIEGVYQGVIGEANLLAAILMSFIGSALIPVVTYFFFRKNRDAIS